MIQHKINWCFEQHDKTNHKYDNYLPYTFHLKMVAQVGNKFSHLLDDTKDYFTDEPISKIQIGSVPAQVTLRTACMYACYAHDIIEDTRNTFNDVKEVLGAEVAEIVYALTNEKGKTRKDRANYTYYNGIINTKGAVFVKLCDRIANVTYGKFTGSRMFDLYEKENPDFIKNLGYHPTHEYIEMFDYLNDLFK